MSGWQAETEVDDLNRVERLLREIAEPRPVPEVRLTDSPESSYGPYWAMGSQRHIAVSHSALLRPLPVLRFELAHEYAHFLAFVSRTRQRLSYVWERLSVGAFVLSLALLPFAVAATMVGLVREASVVLIAGSTGLVFILAGLCSWSLLQRRQELQADALAVKLLGERSPALAWLDCLQATHERRSWRDRVASYITHPSPIRRRRVLLGNGEGTGSTRGNGRRQR